jgi:AraC-like DNA-binding protein
LPAIAVIRHDEWETPLVALLADEIIKDAPGQSVLLDRLLDLLCLAAVRACFTRPGAEPPAWYRASADAIIGPALELIHNNPSQPWTVASLAAHVGASRAAFARRFTDLIGEPPLTYLTNWRLDLAADHLLESDATVNRVAHAVGYGSPFAFSHAFKRRTGTSPTEYRLRRTA